jgi:replicative DNA helicase
MFEDEAPPAKADTRTAVERYGVVSLQEMYLDILHQHDNKKLSCGFTTGIKEIDIILGDLRRGNVTLLAAMTSWGKSSFAVMTTFANLKTDARPLVISAEDARILYGRRMLARDQQINALRLRGNELSKEDYKKVHAAAQSASTAPIFLEVIGKPVEHIAKAIREIAKECGTGLVICDYLQRIKTEKNFNDRRNQVTYVGETLGDAIKNSNAAGLVMSQLKRIENREPGMDDIKESGDLENMAEHVLIGWKEVQKSGYGGDNKAPFRKLNVPKNKDGPIDARWLHLGFHEDTASFTGRLWDGSDSPPSNYVPEPEQTDFDQYEQHDAYEEERYP